MKKNNRKLRIFLADLTHTGMRVATEGFPLNVGLIASYAQKRFGRDIDVKLFKYPDKLLDAMQSGTYDVFAASTYIWNNNLSEWACEMAKKYNPDSVTVRGGWNFPLDENQQAAYLRKHRFTDIFCMNEGELAFAGIIERILGISKMGKWATGPLSGSAFLRPDDKRIIVRGNILPRITALDDIPSPYINGMMDEFFDGGLTPMIETTRGCPFECNYCNNSDAYYNKVGFFSKEYVAEDIAYIAKKIALKGIKNLIITDTNFGMYPRDKGTALCLKDAQKKYKWPLGIIVSTGKNDVKQIIENTEILGNCLAISMSVQSMNPDTLKEIKRDRINLDMYKELSMAMEKNGRPQIAELIVPLPKETYKSYMEGVEKLINMKAKRVVSYTLQLNNGTAYKNEDYRKRFGYEGKYRLIPYDFGIYGGVKVFDYEEVATSSASLNFKEYLKIRKFALVMEMLFSNEIFKELFKLLKERGISNFALLHYALEGLDSASGEIKSVFDSFVSETVNELHSDEDELIRYYADDENYKRLLAGEVGGNVIFKHKGIMLGKYSLQWAEYVFGCAEKILKISISGLEPEETRFQLSAIKVFITSKLDGLFAPEKTNDVSQIDMPYDIITWLKSESGPLDSFRTNNELFSYRFYFDDNQKDERRDLFGRYGIDVSGIAKILARVPALERMFRAVEKI